MKNIEARARASSASPSLSCSSRSTTVPQVTVYRAPAADLDGVCDREVTLAASFKMRVWFGIFGHGSLPLRCAIVRGERSGSCSRGRRKRYHAWWAVATHKWGLHDEI